MMNPDYARFMAFPERDRLDLFLGTATRLGTSIQNVEKDFWVCWTLDALFNGLPAGGPRLLFKGGTSLSRGHGLISRFSEDIDITVFREDLQQSATVEELEKLGTKARGRKLDAIREACSAFIIGPLREELERLFRDIAPSASLRVESDSADQERQSLLLWYPRLSEADDGYVGPAVKIEAGAKSALDPHHPLTVRPYLAEDLVDLNLDVPNVTTVAPERTFWDKVVILHGLHRWYEEKGELKGEGQRVSRHYYDLHRLLDSAIASPALNDLALGRDCVRHAQMFFNRAAYDLNSAQPGSFALLPHDGMVSALRRDYERMSGMIFGEVPDFDQVMGSVARLEELVNQS
jgi:Nucleotidyl transferase AbiEii toxin, Type IV TA system